MAYLRAEDRRAAERRRYAANREAMQRKGRENVAARNAALTPEQRHVQYQARWQREKGREHVRAAKRAEAARIQREAITAYGGRCACCGNDYAPHLTLDHVEGGGTQERREARGARIARRLRREGWPPGYQVLCWNCNWAKHHEGGRCRCQDGLSVVREAVG